MEEKHGNQANQNPPKDTEAEEEESCPYEYPTQNKNEPPHVTATTTHPYHYNDEFDEEEEDDQQKYPQESHMMEIPPPPELCQAVPSDIAPTAHGTSTHDSQQTSRLIDTVDFLSQVQPHSKGMPQFCTLDERVACTFLVWLAFTRGQITRTDTGRDKGQRRSLEREGQGTR